ncbi:MAG: hypothetical protein Q8M66_05385 [Actinomycetota bacterium]|nr:hypothetical protein [Actinomycetota bacterium]MDZ4177630.1 hypothetical protein [Coriobacteriia bacterium]
MKQAQLFAIGVLGQATFGLLAVVVTRWAFRSWPAGAYTWTPGLIGLAGALVLAGLAYVLAVRGLSFVLVASAWFFGRLAGAIAAAVVPGVGVDPVLVATASFGLLVLDGNRLTIGTPSLLALLAQLAILSLAYLWGKRGRRQRVGSTESA